MLIYLHQNSKYDNIRFKRAVNLEKKKKNSKPFAIIRSFKRNNNNRIFFA